MRTSTSQKRKNDKSVPVPESPSKQLKPDHQPYSAVGKTHVYLLNKHTLLDEPQKDRIIYLKPQCVELLLARLEDAEARRAGKSQLSFLNENDSTLRTLLAKMLQRSLDLLRHDRVESFDALASQLKTEYNIEDKKVSNADAADVVIATSLQSLSDVYFSRIDADTNDLVFKQLLRQMLVEEKVLLSLALEDKDKLRPVEEVIEFLKEGGEDVASAWLQKFKENPASGAAENKKANPTSEKKHEAIELANKPVNTTNAKEAAIISDSTQNMKPSHQMSHQKSKSSDEKTVESLSAKNEIEAKLLDTLNQTSWVYQILIWIKKK